MLDRLAKAGLALVFVLARARMRLTAVPRVTLNGVLQYQISLPGVW